MKNVMLALGICLLLILPVAARNYESVDDFFNDIPTLNKQLQTNDIIIPKPVDMLISSGNVLISLQENNQTKEFYLTVQDKRITSVILGKPEKINYIVSVDEEISNELVSIETEEQLNAVLPYYESGKIKVEAIGPINKMKLLFAKIFMNFQLISFMSQSS